MGKAGPFMESVRAGTTLVVGLAISDIQVEDLWVRYFALTGRHSHRELMAYLVGASTWTACEHDIAAQALNEYLSEQGLDHPVRYAHEL